MRNPLRIGTRDSQLALWQANEVKRQLEAAEFKCEIVTIKSFGDLNLKKPIHQMSGVGVFTKTLDLALLDNRIDLAVHSMKDVPTQLTKGLVQAAVLKRGDIVDILVYKNNLNFLKSEAVVATGSLRRRAQWLAEFPMHKVVDLRGNIHSRLKKLENHLWQGAIFAKAGLARLSLLPSQYLELDWMIPAPAQGVLMVVAREQDSELINQVQMLNDPQTAFCASQERAFLKTLEGGCSAPIGAFANIENEMILFKGALFSIDGLKKVVIDITVPYTENSTIGKEIAEKVLEQGGDEIMQEIRKELNQ